MRFEAGAIETYAVAAALEVAKDTLDDAHEALEIAKEIVPSITPRKQPGGLRPENTGEAKEQNL